PQSLGAGGAYTSIADDQSAFFLNPAGISRHAQERKLYFSTNFHDRIKDWQLSGGFIDGITEDPLHFGFLFNTVRTGDYKKDEYILAPSLNLRNIVLIGVTNRIVKFNSSPGTPDTWEFAADAGVLIFPL